MRSSPRRRRFLHERNGTNGVIAYHAFPWRSPFTHIRRVPKAPDAGRATYGTPSFPQTPDCGCRVQCRDPVLRRRDFRSAQRRIHAWRNAFSSTALSADGTVSCATCHRPELAFTDGRAVAVGVDQRQGTRNSPTLIDLPSDAPLFWDGRRQHLEELIVDPLTSFHEHGFATAQDVADRVGEVPALREAYARTFGSDAAIDAQRLSAALAAYVRSIDTEPTALEKFLVHRDTARLTREQQRGLELFRGRAGCTGCHTLDEKRATLTDNQFHDRGIGARHREAGLGVVVNRALSSEPERLGQTIPADAAVAALGRFVVTRNPKDIGAFRTPTLRNVAVTGPYMHDGSIASLADAVDHELYYADETHGAGFDAQDRQALVAFLSALTEARYCHRDSTCAPSATPARSGP
ncbi:cytochrome-c peroxidase [Tahibacter amnicola]|uniref:Cytochrome c domain-containing protein n=1 Tax=Tahibacter amnicola TaxID=2976241 RepID=A0ABY6BE16_9GAMM|nr:cytochrome c peroxidase [Tahibacter amnicola]UXI68268.1 hypothetical protein N4264_01070 [Tahibacter amnicola]